MASELSLHDEILSSSDKDSVITDAMMTGNKDKQKTLLETISTNKNLKEKVNNTSIFDGKVFVVDFEKSFYDRQIFATCNFCQPSKTIIGYLNVTSNSQIIYR